jgi:hypothetical protein
MLTVAQPYFESDDFRGDVILYAAFPHPLLKRLVRFECGPDSLMRTDDRTDALSRYFEPRVYQRNRAHLCLPGPRYSPLARADTEASAENGPYRQFVARIQENLNDPR